MHIPKQYYIWLSVGFILLGIFEFYKKEELDWRPTLSTRDDLPYGTLLNFELAKEGRWKEGISRINQTFFEYSQQDSSNYTSVFMADRIDFDESSTKALLAHVAKGNVALLIGNSFPYTFLDTLQIEVASEYTKSESSMQKLSKGIAFTDTLNKIRALRFDKYFAWDDTLTHVNILGTKGDKPNFVDLRFGEGKFLFHLSPLVFTNYYFSFGNNFDYVNAVFSQLPQGKLVWDDYLNNGNRKPASELRYILSSIPIRYAYYLMSVVFVLFFSLFWRREQKMIPIINPPQNASIAFLNTLTNLYLSNKNNNTIASYLVRNLRIKTKRKYLIQWNKPIIQVKAQIANKTGKSEHEINELIKQISIAENNQSISQEQLIKINKTIENFLQN